MDGSSKEKWGPKLNSYFWNSQLKNIEYDQTNSKCPRPTSECSVWITQAQCESHRWKIQQDVPLTTCLPITYLNQTVPCPLFIAFFSTEFHMSEKWVLCVNSLIILFCLPMDLSLFSLKITNLKNVYLKNFFTQYIFLHILSSNPAPLRFDPILYPPNFMWVHSFSLQTK